MKKAARDRKAKKVDKRARRFPVRAHVRYRIDGRWQEGTTENISNSGLLLRTGDDVPHPDTPIEMIVELPPVLAGEPSANMICEGKVVRAEDTDAADGTRLAAEISRYRFGRDDAAESE